MITAQLTALADDGKSYFQISSNSGKSFVKLDTSNAVLMSAGCGKCGSRVRSRDSESGNLSDSSVRIGMWKLAVSSVHKARKKRYCRRIGWVESQPELADCPSVLDRPVRFCPAAVPFVRSASAEGNGGNGGGGDRGSAGEDGVAFSMRAHVR